MDLGKVVAAGLAATVVVAVLHKGGIWGRHAPEPPPPPTPARIAYERAEAERARQEAAARPPPAAAAPAAPTETPEVLPEGAAREATFYRCTACHSTAIITRQGLSRERWDVLMDWMTEKHGMPVLEGEERTQIVDYLAEAFPPRAQRGRPGFTNPFAN